MRRESLFDYHQRINRDRQERTRDNRRSIDMLRIRSRVRELDARIDGATRSTPARATPPSAAWSAMFDLRLASRTIVEDCAAITLEVRQGWLQRIDATRASNGETPARIRTLASEVEAIAQELSKISANLASAALKRSLPPLPFRFDRSWSRYLEFADPNADALPLVASGVAASFEIPRLSWPISNSVLANPALASLAVDLRPIHDQIADAPSLSTGLRNTWLDRLDGIDQASGGLARFSTSAQKAEKFAADVKAVQSNLESIAASLRDFARKYQAWWDE